MSEIFPVGLCVGVCPVEHCSVDYFFGRSEGGGRRGGAWTALRICPRAALVNQTGGEKRNVSATTSFIDVMGSREVTDDSLACIAAGLLMSPYVM